MLDHDLTIVTVHKSAGRVRSGNVSQVIGTVLISEHSAKHKISMKMLALVIRMDWIGIVTVLHVKHFPNKIYSYFIFTFPSCLHMLFHSCDHCTHKALAVCCPATYKAHRYR